MGLYRSQATRDHVVIRDSHLHLSAARPLITVRALALPEEDFHGFPSRLLKVAIPDLRRSISFSNSA